MPAEAKKPYRSVSQFNEYTKCPYAYKLNRIDKAWQRPAAWLPMGLGVHEAAEAYEKSGRTLTIPEVQEAYVDSYVTHTNRLAADTPDFSDWFASGPYRGKEDVERRFTLGRDQVVGYVGYYEQHPDEVIWIDDKGEPAIELHFNVDLDGVQVLGYIDQVIRKADGSVVVRDIKSGNTPGDDFQLAVYAVAIAETNDVDITTGDYWMGRKSKPTVPYDLTYWTRTRIAEAFAEVDAGILAGEFPANPSADNCRFCSVARACEYSFA